MTRFANRGKENSALATLMMYFRPAISCVSPRFNSLFLFLRGGLSRTIVRGYAFYRGGLFITEALTHLANAISKNNAVLASALVFPHIAC